MTLKIYIFMCIYFLLILC